MKSLSSKNSEAPMAATIEASKLPVNRETTDMNSLAKVSAEFTIFRFGDNDIRVIDKSGDPWFVATDVCDALGLTNSRMSLKALDDDEKGVSSAYTIKGNQELATISESGMYTLVLRCRDAIKQGTVPYKFRKWVTSEVLPTVRKHGFYEKPTAIKKGRKSTATQLTPLRQTAERLIATGLGKIYPDIWKLVHKKFDIEHIHQLEPQQIGEAVEYLSALEGEYLGNANKQLSLPISYPMSWFDKYRWIIGDDALSSPCRYPSGLLVPNGDYPNPLGKMLGEMRAMGYEVEAALFQLLSLQHHLERIRHKIEVIERAVR